MPIPRMNFRDRLELIALRSGEDACWEWPGFTDKGYGKVTTTINGECRCWYAHVAAYALLVGPVPDGKELDHLCRNRPCMNPRHLEPVTHQVNGLRGESPWARNSRKTHCKRGHPFDEANTMYVPGPDGRPMRQCRECNRTRIREFQREKRKTPEGLEASRKACRDYYARNAERLRARAAELRAKKRAS